MKKAVKYALAAAPYIAAGTAVFLLAPARAARKKAGVFWGQNMAHRGLFTEDQSIPENSVAAFRRAADAGYGMELDVQLSKDGKVVVFHDDTLERMCGDIKGNTPGSSTRVDALDFDELRELRLAGTEEKIPLFTEVLEAVDGRTPIIVELKTGPRNRELCEKTLEILKNYDGETCVESFDPRIVTWFRFHAPQMFRGQLAEPAEGYDDTGFRSRIVNMMLSRTLFNIAARPHFIAYKIGAKPAGVRLAEALGAVRVAWTSHSAETEKDFDVVIFEHYQPKIKYK